MKFHVTAFLKLGHDLEISYMCYSLRASAIKVSF